MLKSWWKIPFALVALIFTVTPAFAQKWSMPGKGTAVPCGTCISPATGKLTYPYNDPIVRHVGRYVDSSTVGNVQNAGMRTVRARTVTVFPGQNRLGVALGETVGLYKLDTFFTTKLGQSLTDVNKFNIETTPWTRYSDPYEKLQMPDRFFYAEARESGWAITFQDSQRQLNAFDMDDRGYLYVSTITFGWGVAQDDGKSNNTHLAFVAQVKSSSVDAQRLFTLKSGAKYYAVISSYGRTSEGTQIYDMTTPSAPTPYALRKGLEHGIQAFARHEASHRLAIVSTDGKLRIYDYSAFLTNGNPVAEFSPSSGSKKFADVAIDESGRVWAVESAKNLASNVIRRFTPSGSSYTSADFDVYGQTTTPVQVSAAAGYVAVTAGTSSGTDGFLFKVDGGTPRLLDLDHFFNKYYSHGPSAEYVALDLRNTFEPGGAWIVEQGGKTYLLYSAGGLGDVYEIQGGEAISATIASGSLGTVNPNAPTTEPGPYYGDILRFKATSNNPSASYSIDWNFDNPESGNADSASSALNQVVTHQFTGLNTAAKIQQTRNVVASVAGDAAINDQLPITLKVPKARLLAPGISTPMTTENKESFEAVAGETFKDASDGVVEGHYATWTIDGVPTPALPNAAIPVGAVGSHTVSLTSSYGKYDPTAFTGTTSPFLSSVANVSYSVKPFIATIKPPTTTSTNYTFSAVARASSIPAGLSATQWNVTWSAGSGASAVTAEQTVSAAVGTIPDFTVPKSSVGNNSVITLQISVDPTKVVSPTYQTYTTTYTLEIPVITITKTSGCTNAGEPCKLTASSGNSASSAAWQLSWVVKRGTTQVATGSGNPLTFTPSEAGSYTATVTETAYNVTKELVFSVAAIACAPVPEAYMVEITNDCGTTCTANQPILFEPSIFGYTVQACDVFTWSMGDSSAAKTGRSVTHTYTQNKTYTVKLTITNSNSTSNSRSWTKSVTVGGGGTDGGGGGSCSAPVAINFSYAGNLGCGPGVPCKTNESVKFTAYRGGSALLACDTTLWSFDGTDVTTKSPTRTFTTPGNHTVTLIVSNTEGTAAQLSQTLNVQQGTSSGCNGSVQDFNLAITYNGVTSKCSNGNGVCQVNETIAFAPSLFGYTFQACDKLEWNFGDGTAVSTLREPNHVYTSPRQSYHVTLKVTNTNAPAGVTVATDVVFSAAPVKPTPVLTAGAFPTTGSKGSPVSFTVASNIDATDWLWDFGDGSTKQSQTSVGRSATISHTFTKAGTFTVLVKARNAEDVPTAQTGQAFNTITVSDVPEYKFLLPVVTHINGQAGSVWRTDMQIFNSTPSTSTPLRMTAKLRDKEITLEVFDSTYIYEDFMQRFTSGTDSGPVVITARTAVAPQIWTRTYNQAENGTFGQFIPAIRLDSAGGGSATGSGKYYLAGLRHDARYRTNLGFISPNDQAINATVRVYDDRGLPIGSFTRALQPFQLDQFPITSAVPTLDGTRPFSIEVEVPDGQWLIAYASFIDGASNDPVYVQATRDSDLVSDDNRTIMLPGVGHVGNWRSDVTVFNPYGRPTVVDLAFFNGTGVKMAEVQSVPIGAGAFLQYDDVLKQGIFGSVEDSLGVIRVTVPSAVSPEFFPVVVARTYNDNGSGKTFGQGIRGFAAPRANVKPGKPALITAVRSNNKYYTNVGLTNVSSASTVVTVKLLNPITGVETQVQQHTIAPNQSIVARVDLGTVETASLKIDTTAGNVWAFGSIVDKFTNDPEYVPATPLAP